MRKEIDKAVETFHRIAFGTKKRSSQSISDHQLSLFVTVLTDLLVARYKNNWYPQNPVRGSGYRCLRMNSQCVDPTINESMLKSDIELGATQRAMELTIWVDPGIVSIRIGEEGSIGMERVDMDPILESSEDEAYSSRSPSPIRPAPTHLITPPKDVAIQHGISSINQQARMIPGAIYPHQHISPPSMQAHSGQFHARAANVRTMTNSQEYLPLGHGHIPASQSSYSRPKALFPPPQDVKVSGNYQGYYSDGIVAAHQPRPTAVPMRLPRNMMRKGNYMDIPAQA